MISHGKFFEVIKRIGYEDMNSYTELHHTNSKP